MARELRRGKEPLVLCALFSRAKHGIGSLFGAWRDEEWEIRGGLGSLRGSWGRATASESAAQCSPLHASPEPHNLGTTREIQDNLPQELAKEVGFALQ